MSDVDEKPKSPKIEMVGLDFSEEHLRSVSTLYEFNVVFFNRAYIIFSFLVICFLIGLYSHKFLWFSLSAIIVVANQFLRLRTLVNSINLERSVSHQKVEQGSPFQIKYKISNVANLTTPYLYLKDFTHYLEYKQNQRIFVVPPLIKYEDYELTVSAQCEAPIGELRLGVIQLEVQDELGLFSFKKNFDTQLVVNVVGKDNKREEKFIRKIQDSPLVGDLEIAKVGHGLSFYGLREYREGDPLNLISWKKSTLEDEFRVKELESDISRRVVIQISQDRHLQIGYGASSTWEFSKKIALSLIYNYLSHKSSVSLVSDEIQLKDLSGNQAYVLFENAIHKMGLRETERSTYFGEGSFFENFVATENHFEMELIEYYVSPPVLYYYIAANAEDIENKLRYLLDLKRRGYEPVFIYISPVTSARVVRKTFKSSIVTNSFLNNDEYEIKDFFIRANIPVIYLEATNPSGQYKVEIYD